jgi:hypothetical protein
MKRELKKLLNTNAKVKKEKKELTQKEKIEKWAKRLAKLTDITIGEAKKIAEEKIEYKEEKICEMEDRQALEHYSRKRESLINKMRRENPLRRIEDEEHAQRIIAASERHNNSNYEDQLDKARELAQFGEIDR